MRPSGAAPSGRLTISVFIQPAMAEYRVEENPVPAFRAVLRDASMMKPSRPEADSTANRIEPPEEIARLVEEFLREDLRDAVFLLLLLEAGMRPAQARALTRGRIAFGTEKDAGSRLLAIDRARVERDYSAKPKSSRSRRGARATPSETSVDQVRPRTSFRIRWMCPRPRPFTSQPSSK